MSYPEIVADVCALLQRPAGAGSNVVPLRGCALGIDSTGVGRAVTDLFRAARPAAKLYPITITAGVKSSYDSGEWHVCKKDLVAVTTVALETDRLGWDRRLPFDELLAKELSGFQSRLTPAANEQFGTWREGEHDDLVLAVAIALWLAERGESGRVTRPIAVRGMGSVMPQPGEFDRW